MMNLRTELLDDCSEERRPRIENYIRRANLAVKLIRPEPHVYEECWEFAFGRVVNWIGKKMKRERGVPI